MGSFVNPPPGTQLFTDRADTVTPTGASTEVSSAIINSLRDASYDLRTGLYAETSRAQAAENALAPLASPALTGIPTAPTATAGTNSTQLATTAFVLGQAGTAIPLVDGVGAAGTSLNYARQDHVHPGSGSGATSPFFNVKDYGAVGNWNGTSGTDDTGHIQNAINALPAHGGTLVFPNGDYLINTGTSVNGITAGLVIPRDKRVCLMGEGGMGWLNGTGDRATSRLVTTSALWILSVGDSTTGSHGFTMQGMSLGDYSASGAGGTALGGIYIFNTNHIRIQDCTFTAFTNTSASAIKIDGTAGSSICNILSGNNFNACFNAIRCVGANVTDCNIIGGFMSTGATPPTANSIGVDYAGDTLQMFGVAIDNYATGVNMTLVSNDVGHRIIGSRFEQCVNGLVITGCGRCVVEANHFYSTQASTACMVVNNAPASTILYPHSINNVLYLATPATGVVNGVLDNTATTGNGTKITNDPVF